MGFHESKKIYLIIVRIPIMESMINENGVIMQQIIRLLSNVQFDNKNILNSLANILSIIPKIGTILISKYLVNNLGKAGQLFFKHY